MNLGASVLPSTFFGILPVGGMYLISINQLNYAEFFLCIVLSLGVVAPIKNFTNYVNHLESIQYALTEVNQILSLQSMLSTKFKKPQHYEIAFNNVGFSYNKDKDDLVFKHLSFTVPENNFTAIVGASGSGKSTIAKLISRYWDVTFR